VIIMADLSETFKRLESDPQGGSHHLIGLLETSFLPFLLVLDGVLDKRRTPMGGARSSCNFYLQNGCFPDFYEEMQAIPVLSVGILPYAADDGGARGQALDF
jgi:hypothetical protein